MMKRHERLPRIDIKPELPAKKKLKEQFETVRENARYYDHVIWLIDLDTILRENAQSKAGQKSKLQEFKEYVERLARYDNVNVLVNTPCLEFWFLLHLKSTRKFYAECEGISKELRKNSLLSDYEKSERYYKKSFNDIYLKLKPHLPTAMANAANLGKFDFREPYVAKAEIYAVFEMLEMPV